MLKHPLTRGLDIDNPQTTALRRKIINSKPFLKCIYMEWYQLIAAATGTGDDYPVLEIGSGAGFLQEHVAGAITSDVLPVPGLDVVMDGCQLPLLSDSLDGVVMVNVFHHISDVMAFMKEAARCTRIGGKMVMIEPWVTPWSNFVYRNFHHEPCNPSAVEWMIPEGGPLSVANSALPWIVFERDRGKLKEEVPEWELQQVNPFMPFRYLLSGGIARRSLMPYILYPFWEWMEKMLSPWNKYLGMFALIELKRC